MKIEAIISGLIGVAFGARALDAKKPLWARVAYGAVGYDLMRASYDALVRGEAMAGAQSSAPVRSLSTGQEAPALKFNEVRVRSIDERVARVHEQMVNGTRDPKVYGLARSVLSARCGDGWCVPERDYMGEFTALFNEVRKRVRYTWDPTDYDAFQTPGKTLELQNGDCDDQVALLGAMLRSIGHKVRSRIVQTQGFDTWNHIYLVAQHPGTKEWIPLDTTVNQPAGWEVPADIVIKKRDFDVLERGGAPAVRA